MRRTPWLLLAATLIALLAGFRQMPDLPTLADLGRSAEPSQAVDKWNGPEPTRHEVLEALDAATVIQTRPTVAGYDRECGTGHGCVFGPAWSDDTGAAGAHNGCDTRNDVLAQQLDDVVYRAGTNDCVVTAGSLTDPYTGEIIDFTKERAIEVGIDHIYPLARAWDMGAAQWPLDKRMQFANDPAHNLLAVSGPANSSKGDRGPGEWMPINRGYACTYAARYLDAANTYALPITAADADSLKAAASTCPTATTAER